MGGKKGGGKGKKKEQEEKDVLTEVDREYYELQLVDLKRKLSRLRSRSQELESVNCSLEEELKTLDEDRADIIAYLKKTLLIKTNEMTELQERLDGLNKAMESSVVMYTDKISQMEQDYKNMHEELTSEIKLLMGKLNSLEEFRTQRDELMAKFASQEEKMAELEHLRQTTIYDAEKNLALEKDKLKKQMEARLMELSKQFQEATDVRIASTTHRMIRENIAVNNELDIMQEVQKKMLLAFDEMKQSTHKAKLEVQLRDEERDQALRKCLAQKQKITSNQKENDDLKKKIEDMENLRAQNASLVEEAQNLKQQLKEAKYEIKMVNSRYADGQQNAAKLYADVAALKVNGRRLHSLLNKAVSAVQDALTIKQQPNQDAALVSFRRDHLLLNLLELLNRATTADKDRFVIKKQTSVIQNYSLGDLGLVPRSHSQD